MGSDATIELEVRPVVLAEWAHEGAGPWVLVFPLLWLAIVAGLVFLFRRRWGTDHVRSGRAVLAERFARGEITEEEYRTRAAVLKERSR
jgi:putative membrane protein